MSNLEGFTKIYSNEDYKNAFKQRKKLLIVFWAILSVFAILNLLIFLYYLTLPYGASRGLLLLSHGVLATFFVVFCFVFMGIKYGRIRSYCKFLVGIDNGIIEENEGYFKNFGEEIEEKDGVDCNVMILDEWNDKKSTYMDRKVFIDKEKKVENFKAGSLIRYYTYANMLLAYKAGDNE